MEGYQRASLDVGKVLSSARESRSQHTFRVRGCRVTRTIIILFVFLGFFCFVLGSASGLTVIPSQCRALLIFGSGKAENSDPLTELQCEQHGDVLYGGLF